MSRIGGPDARAASQRTRERPARSAVTWSIGKAGPVDFLWFLALAGLIGGLWYVAYRIEPHWSSKDGTRFMCTTQAIWGDHKVGKNKETHVAVTGDGYLLVQEKRMLRRNRSYWTLVGKSESPPKGKQVYLAVPNDTSGDRMGLTQMTIHIPNKSRVVPVLDELLEHRPGFRPDPSPSGIAPPVDQPDPD